VQLATLTPTPQALVLPMKSCKACFGNCLNFGGKKETPQFLILGLDGVGKSTLLYTLKLKWPSREVPSHQVAHEFEQMRLKNEKYETDDPGYHFEEFDDPWKYGMWEVPGTQAMRRMWASFYHSIKIHCVVFVVDGDTRDDDRINLAKKNLHVLMNEDELRQACFVIIINQRKKGADEDVYNKDDDILYYRLGLHKLHESNAWRTKQFIINILEDHSRRWSDVLDFVKGVLNKEPPKGFGLGL